MFLHDGSDKLRSCGWLGVSEFHGEGALGNRRPCLQHARVSRSGSHFLHEYVMISTHTLRHIFFQVCILIRKLQGWRKTERISRCFVCSSGEAQCSARSWLQDWLPTRTAPPDPANELASANIQGTLISALRQRGAGLEQIPAGWWCIVLMDATESWGSEAWGRDEGDIELKHWNTSPRFRFYFSSLTLCDIHFSHKHQ